MTDRKLARRDAIRAGAAALAMPYVITSAALGQGDQPGANEIWRLLAREANAQGLATLEQLLVLGLPALEVHDDRTCRRKLSISLDIYEGIVDEFVFFNQSHYATSLFSELYTASLNGSIPTRR